MTPQKANSWSESPNITCPACGHSWHEAEYYELGKGSEIKCADCGALLECTHEDVIRAWEWTTTTGSEDASGDR